MDSTVIVTAAFSAAHSVPGDPMCGERHGHTWTVTVEILGVEAAVAPGVPADVRLLVDSYDHHDLDRYLPGVETTCSGLAAFFHERLSAYPVSAIEVGHEGYRVRLSWPTR